MPTLVTEPSNILIHPSGPVNDCVVWGVTTDLLVTNSPAKGSVTFEFTGFWQLNGDHFVLADQVFDIVNSGSYTGNSVDLTAGTAEEMAIRLYGAFLSNPEISANAVITYKLFPPGNWRVTVAWLVFKEYETWLDISGLVNPGIVLSQTAPVVPAIDENVSLEYQLLNEDNEPYMLPRSVVPGVTLDGEEQEVVLNFTGEINGWCETSLPEFAQFPQFDERFFRKFRLRFGPLTFENCQVTGGTFDISKTIPVCGAATQVGEDWGEYQYDGNGIFVINDQKFLTKRPRWFDSCADQYEWAWFVLGSNLQHPDASDVDYFIEYETQSGIITTENVGPSNTDGVVIVPIGAGNAPVTITPSDSYFEVVVKHTLTGGSNPGEFALSEVLRIYVKDECCGHDYRDIYFVEPLGSLSCIRTKYLEEKEVNQEYGKYYRPFICSDSTSTKLSSKGTTSYGHYAEKRARVRFSRLHTPELEAYIEAFRSSVAQYILINTSPLTWQKILVDEGGVKTRLRGKMLEVDIAFTFHAEISMPIV